ncbi:CHRD domain-containing protein [Sphingomonas sp. ZT3P38]|uniref:CHRD domain-containing protein n=1 Tax=Parasphingomonas zepuensis TaxID=3096161 RepID=UPI002FC96C60
MRLILLTLAAVMSAAPALAADPVKLQATLAGSAESDADGTGSATVTIDPAKSEVCYTLKVSGIEPATMAHIHKGAAGVSGPVVVPLDAPTSGTAQGCKPAAAEVIAAIVASPADYYVNVHNATFPKGAIRGQLSR